MEKVKGGNTMNGKYKYHSGNTTFKGDFNIYQARNGAIIIVMGNKNTALTLTQINELSIDCYRLTDFDHELFVAYYRN